jgi:hypothetical protein
MARQVKTFGSPELDKRYRRSPDAQPQRDQQTVDILAAADHGVIDLQPAVGDLRRAVQRLRAEQPKIGVPAQARKHLADLAHTAAVEGTSMPSPDDVRRELDALKSRDPFAGMTVSGGRA